MNLFILTDIEGVSGITDIEQIERGTPAYAESCKKLVHDLNLAVDTCFACGASKVYYLDGHAGGGNADPATVDSRAISCSIEDWGALLREGKIDYLIDLGAHARAGTIGGFLDHTINSKRNFYIKIGGVEMSEFSLHAIFCAHYGVPVIAVLGDLAACAQAKEYVPSVYTGAVKEARVRNRAVAYENADTIIKETICNALSNRDKIGLIEYQSPLVIEQAFYRTDMCEEALAACKVDALRLDARTLQKTINAPLGYRDLLF